jgi:hypothetical protein
VGVTHVTSGRKIAESIHGAPGPSKGSPYRTP